ncbi:MAG TPA: YhcH/YjgK/YiaL family protein [Candidatus Didemnitutus sp.]|nr:YhcH/YjgK/YiaL family protein [Candidatus Didemnitutus sp.]
MAFFGPFSTVREFLARDPRFATAIRYAEELLQPGSPANLRMRSRAVGPSERIDVANGTYVLEQAYLTRARSETYFESHLRNIDVQLVLEGTETMGVEDISRLKVSMPYDSEAEIIKYFEPATESRLVIKAGDAAVFFPCDGHMPTLHFGPQALVRKSVIKIPVGG